MKRLLKTGEPNIQGHVCVIVQLLVYSLGDTVHQLVSPHSVATVRLPTITLGERSGVKLVVARQDINQDSVFEEGSGGIYLNNHNQNGDDTAYISSIFEGNLNSWSLNNHVENSSKSICYNPFNKEMKKNKSADISVAIFSTSSKVQDFTIRTVENKEYLLPLDQEVEFELSNQSATVFQFDRGLDFIPDQENYLVTIESVTNPKKCIHVGISDPGCPWNDDKRTVRNNKIWARILSLGYFSIKARKFPNSFVIILLPTEDDEESCSTTPYIGLNKESKKMKMKITIAPESFRKPIITSVICLSVPTILSIVGLFLFWRKKYKDHETAKEVEIKEPYVDNHEHEFKINNLDDPDGEKLCAVCVGEEAKKKKILFLPDLLIKYQEDNWHRKLRSVTYLYLIPLVSIFYIIPSAQMVFINRAGSNEPCFFNYGCARPWWIFDSFNHIYSNAGYIWLGLCFILLVKIKSYYFPEDRGSEYGLPQQYSVFYAMGFAMIFQGVLSCIFHVCPSNMSLQFDTTMMYLIMTLVFVKIYQFRHPDTTINAFLCMFTLCLALIFEALSLYIVQNTITKALFISTFSLLYFGIIMYLGVNFYFNRSIKKSWHLKKNLEKLKKKLEEPGLLAHKLRFVTSVMFVVVNIVVFLYVLYSIGSKGTSLSTPFILIFGGNMFIYVTYYMARKILDILQTVLVTTEKQVNAVEEDPETPKTPEEEGWIPWLARITGADNCKQEEEHSHNHEEENEEDEQILENQCQVNLIRWFSFFLFGASIIIGCIALAFYANKHQSRSMSPPESRERNQLCKFGDFFDNHDMWHFLSSVALFLAFLGLLTIDDDLLYVKRKAIKVF